jgi:hypothetical protein
VNAGPAPGAPVGGADSNSTSPPSPPSPPSVNQTAATGFTDSNIAGILNLTPGEDENASDSVKATEPEASFSPTTSVALVPTIMLLAVLGALC